MVRLRDVPARRLPGTPAWRKYGAIDFDTEGFELGLDEVTFGESDPWAADALLAVCR